MKILLWTSYYFPSIGGLEVMTHALATQLQKMGHEVLVISSNVRSEAFEEIIIDDIKIHLLPFSIALSHRNLPLIKKTIYRAHQIINDFTPEIVNVHGWFENIAFYQTRILEQKKVPLCLTLHGLIEQKNYDSSACSKLWSMAQKVSVVSQSLINELIKQKIQHSQMIELIYNALPLSQSEAVPLPLQTRLIMVGRLSEEKGFETGFYAMQQLIQKYSQLKLTMVGGGFQFNYLAELKKKLHLDEHIEMTDFVHPAKVSQYIDQASLMIIPSYYEPFGLVSLEAAMRARPVVASNVSGLNEIVQHEQTGLLVKPKNPDALANAVDHLLSQPEKLQRMGLNAEKRVRALFIIENTAKQYIQLYQQAVALT